MILVFNNLEPIIMGPRGKNGLVRTVNNFQYGSLRKRESRLAITPSRLNTTHKCLSLTGGSQTSGTYPPARLHPCQGPLNPIWRSNDHWDTKGVYHQHYVDGGQILHISDQPLAVKSIVLNME